MRLYTILLSAVLAAVLAAQTPPPNKFDTTRDVVRAEKKIEMGSKDKKDYEIVIKGSLILEDFQKIIDKFKLPAYTANIDPLLKATAIADAYIGLKNFDEAMKAAEAIKDDKEKNLRLARAYYGKSWCNKAIEYYHAFLDKGGKIETFIFRDIDVQGYRMSVPEYWIVSPGKKSTDGDWETSSWTFYSLYGVTYRVNSFYYTPPADEEVLEQVIKSLKGRIASDYEKAGMVAVMERGKLTAVKKTDIGKSFKGFFGKAGGSDPKAPEAGGIWYTRDNKRENLRVVDVYLLPDAVEFADARMDKSLVQIVASYYYFNSAASDRNYKIELETFLDRLVKR